MDLRRRELLKLLGSSVAAGAGVAAVPREALASALVTVRDVCVIGGGGAGAYAALRVRDTGKSVVVVERSGRLGGHAETYRDPNTGVPIDIGVQIFPDLPLVRNYFGRFGVPLITPPRGGGGNSIAVDFRTGLPVAAYSPPQAALGQALLTYLNLVSTRFAFLEGNGYQLPSSGPVLDDLLLPFRDFAARYGLNALLPMFFSFEQGFGSLLDTTSLYVLKNLNASVVGGILGGSFLAPRTGVGSLYDAITTELGGDALLNAKVVTALRCGQSRAYVLVQTDAGLRIIDCKSILFTAPPLLRNLVGFDLDGREIDVFRRFKQNGYYTGVLQLEGLPPGTSLNNAAPETFENLAPMPGIFGISPSPAPGLFNVKYGGSGSESESEVRSNITRAIKRLQVPGLGPVKVKGFATFKSHSPYALMASASDIRGGFYADLQGLQGVNHTYYAGAAHQTHSSAAIWAYVEGLLPLLTA